MHQVQLLVFWLLARSIIFVAWASFVLRVLEEPPQSTLLLLNLRTTNSTFNISFISCLLLVSDKRYKRNEKRKRVQLIWGFSFSPTLVCLWRTKVKSIVFCLSEYNYVKYLQCYFLLQIKMSVLEIYFLLHVYGEFCAHTAIGNINIGWERSFMEGSRPHYSLHQVYQIYQTDQKDTKYSIYYIIQTPRAGTSKVPQNQGFHYQLCKVL